MPQRDNGQGMRDRDRRQRARAKGKGKGKGWGGRWGCLFLRRTKDCLSLVHRQKMVPKGEKGTWAEAVWAVESRI